MGWIRMFHDWDWRDAEASFARALDLSPGNALVMRRSAFLAQFLGHLEEAIALYRRVAEQDPLSPVYSNLAIVLHSAGRLTEAEAAFRTALELAPGTSFVHALLSLTLLAEGRGEDALAEAMGEPDEERRLWALAIVHHGMGHGAESEATLRELIAKHSDTGAAQIAEVHAARGEADAAFEWLERAVVQRDPGVVEVKSLPHVRSLHGDPRWGAFLKKIGLED